ncbi:MAG: histidinol-phosphate/aromatic aminotransferase/cobyric acid decarboxylase-like protein [Rhodothermales bacterium]|jgi:histidinol-phosphate/aromatic aminotransferase/cobyric acid decarboxylase-like protein/GNAT superfamily N-acetyltransferase
MQRQKFGFERPLVMRIAAPSDREQIFRLRHQVFGTELGQHQENETGQLRDRLDSVNEYIVAAAGSDVVACISITPPNAIGYSIDKYIDRGDLSIPFDSGLYELRLLLVTPDWRRSGLAQYLMYAAYRWASERGATHFVCMGRSGSSVGLYERIGFRPSSLAVRSGLVDYQIMTASAADFQDAIRDHESVLVRMEDAVDWDLPYEVREDNSCYHGGASVTALGDTFHRLEKSDMFVTADVLDAWYPPAPGVTKAIATHLPYLLRTSPPTDCGGLLREIARARSIPYAGLVAGAGSSDLIFRAFGTLLPDKARVLLLDPTYGEYAFAAKQLKDCRIDRVALSAQNGYMIDPADFEPERLRAYDLVILVNPNSPTGQYVDSDWMLSVIQQTGGSTLFWIDETYIDYVGQEHSLERLAPTLDNVIVCKSMSKVYALSGARVGYISTQPARAALLRAVTPPWVVGHVGQLAGICALQDPQYYRSRQAQTADLRRAMVSEIREIPGIDEVVEGEANFFVVLLSDSAPTAGAINAHCRESGVYLREFGNMTDQGETQALRIAVRDVASNRRVIQALRRALDPNTRVDLLSVMEAIIG